MIKVLRLVPELNYGGVETRLTLQAKNNHFYDYEIDFCAFHNKGVAWKNISDAGFSPIILDRSPSVKKLSSTLALYRFLKSNKYDVIHCSVPEANFHGSLAGKMAGVPCVIVEEVGDPSTRSFLGHCLAAFSMHLADFVVGVSEPVCMYLRKIIRLPERKIVSINNGVEPSDVPGQSALRQTRMKWGIPFDSIVIGSVGRLNDTHKRFSDLMTAFSMLKSEKPLFLVVAGDGPDMQRLKDFAKELKIEGNTIFLGRQDDMHSVYAAFDIFSLLSEQEAFGLVVVEAMFRGLPAVVTDVGGMSDIVVDDVTGFKVPRYNSVSASKSLQKLVDSSDLRNSFGLNGRSRAVTEFSSDRYLSEVNDLYQHAFNVS